MSNDISIVILAAGQGSRMRSRLPKVLHPLAGRPMLAHVLETAHALNPRQIVVVHGHGGETVCQAFANQAITWVKQAEQRGTGHAVNVALPSTQAEDRVLVLYGDVPLVRADTLKRLLETLNEGVDLALLTTALSRPTGYGRILRDDSGRVTGIVEEKDASDSQRRINEVNTGILAARSEKLAHWLSQVTDQNAQGEYYLTDCVALANGESGRVEATVAHESVEVMGVNDKIQLAEQDRAGQRRQAEALMREGVTLIDPARLDVRGTVKVGQDVSLDVNVILEGHVELGDGVSIGAGCVIRDTVIGQGTVVLPYSVIEGAHIGSHNSIGPFARIRPGTKTSARAKIGTFVEVKNARVGEGSKINHLSYVGDGELGRDVNIGAGTITCNYDGANKHKTIIGDGAFIGSNTALVAPVKVGEGATIGAGTTLNKDAPAGELTVARAKAVTIRGWKRPMKKPKE
ncbi:MAG TPA: bifunctional UDP-N-acetylglucosamine diphosphorylase/glucosamine-1-phosphate N-acetyltransferase GlmU [Thioalkalivibrio sp.]|nr:bifunctional UDP-N-acetylglucosamine diphosphorylase/glucosamine-1-phosphate N-acetyltransferase GlmU [Thioalkalivibrio sp.]